MILRYNSYIALLLKNFSFFIEKRAFFVFFYTVPDIWVTFELQIAAMLTIS